MARTTRIDDLTFLAKNKALAGRSFQDVFGSSFGPSVGFEVPAATGETGQAHQIPTPTALTKFTDIFPGEPTQAPDIQDITLVSKKTTRAGVPEVRVCSPLNDSAVLSIYAPRSAEAAGASGVRTSSGAASLRGSGGPGVRTSAGVHTSGGAARSSGESAASVRTSGSAGLRQSGSGAADAAPLPFTPVDLIVGLPQLTMWHPLETRVKPTIPVLHTTGVPAEW
jgi:hypothetical protein